MKKNQNGFTIIAVLVVGVLGILTFAGWYILNDKSSSPASNVSPPHFTQSNSSSTYKILGTESYRCTKSIPAQCSGNIKIEATDGSQRTVQIDQKTSFNGADPADLYKADKSPLNAELELSGNSVKSIKLQ